MLIAGFRFMAPPVVASPHRAAVSVQLCAPAAESPMNAAKESLLTAIGSGSLEMVDNYRQQTVEECILQLDNPTPEPARSILLNGKWEVMYAGSPGAGFLDSPTRPLALALYSPLSPSIIAQGLSKLPLVGASLGTLIVTIRSPEAGQPRAIVETSVGALGSTQPITFRANLAPRSAVTLKEDFVEAEAFGQRQLLPGPLSFSRSLFVSYLDDDLMIVRDDAGAPSVLRRALKFPAATDMSFSDDDAAPGAG